MNGGLGSHHRNRVCQLWRTELTDALLQETITDGSLVAAAITEHILDRHGWSFYRITCEQARQLIEELAPEFIERRLAKYVAGAFPGIAVIKPLPVAELVTAFELDNLIPQAGKDAHHECD